MAYSKTFLLILGLAFVVGLLVSSPQVMAETVQNQENAEVDGYGKGYGKGGYKGGYGGYGKGYGKGGYGKGHGGYGKGHGGRKGKPGHGGHPEDEVEN